MTRRLLKKRVPRLPEVALPDLDAAEADRARLDAVARRDAARAARCAYEDTTDPLVGDIIRSIYAKGAGG